MKKGAIWSWRIVKKETADLVNVNAWWGVTWSVKMWGLGVTLLSKNWILSLSWFKCYNELPLLFGMKIKILNMMHSPFMILSAFLSSLTCSWVHCAKCPMFSPTNPPCASCFKALPGMCFSQLLASLVSTHPSEPRRNLTLLRRLP